MKNVLFILTDDQRYNALGAAGNPDIITPHMDNLAQSGALFTQAHIPCGTSGAVCMPSRAMLLSGRTLFHLQAEGQDIPQSHTTMPEAFRGAGYDTFGTGKWHNGPPAFARGFTGGDNIFFGGMWDHWNVPTCYHDPTGQYDNEINFVCNFSHSNQPTRVHCDKFNPGVHSSSLLTSTAIEYIQDKRPRDQPFFLYLAYLAPHDPRTMPDRYRQLYDPDAIQLPKNFLEQHPFAFGVEGIRDEVLAAQPRNEAEIRRHLAEYYAMITHLDDEIGRLLDALRAQNLLDDPLIVFTGDNGLAVGSHGLMGKQNHYDHSVRVPLVLSGPGIPKGRRVDSYVYLLDIFPTLCELCGLAIPASVEGLSFAQMLDDPGARTRNELYFAYNELIRSVKDERFKLIEYRNFANRAQLFDLKSDPDELHDLIDDPERQTDVARLRALMLRYRDEWEDTGHPYSQAFWDAYCVG